MHAGGVKGATPGVRLTGCEHLRYGNPGLRSLNPGLNSQHALSVQGSLDILESERERKYEVTSPVFRFVRKPMATLKRESEHAGGVVRI